MMIRCKTEGGYMVEIGADRLFSNRMVWISRPDGSVAGFGKARILGDALKQAASEAEKTIDRETLSHLLSLLALRQS